MIMRLDWLDDYKIAEKGVRGFFNGYNNQILLAGLYLFTLIVEKVMVILFGIHI